MLMAALVSLQQEIGVAGVRAHDHQVLVDVAVAWLGVGEVMDARRETLYAATCSRGAALA